jgi:hypothetical protein
VVCLHLGFLGLGGPRSAVGRRPTAVGRASINLGKGAWVSLVVSQPWLSPAFGWCVGVYGKHMDGVVSDENLEVPVVVAH